MARSWLVGFVCAATAAIACNDNRGGADGPTAGSGASSGQSAQSGAGGGSGGAGVPAGASGSSGANASAGAGAGGGASASRRDPAAIAKVAAILGSCLPDDGANRNALYLWEARNSPRLWHQFGRAADCLVANGQGCAAVEACLGWLLEPDTSACQPSCAGSVFSTCSDGLRASLDCAKIGLACDVVGICSAAPAAVCDPESFARSCTAAGLPVFCDDEAVFEGPSCGDSGLRCEAGYCVGTGAACTGERPDEQGGVYFDGMACSGSELLSCVGGREATRDCASIAPGFACQSVQGEPFCGLASECLPALDASRYGDDERCEGNSLVFCNAGRVERVDCVSLGFTGCDVENGFGCVPGPSDFE